MVAENDGYQWKTKGRKAVKNGIEKTCYRDYSTEMSKDIFFSKEERKFLIHYLMRSENADYKSDGTISDGDFKSDHGTVFSIKKVTNYKCVLFTLNIYIYIYIYKVHLKKRCVTTISHTISLSKTPLIRSKIFTI